MKKTKYIDVFKTLKSKKGRKTNLSFAFGKSGVYIIKEDNKIVYIGQSSSNLYTIYFLNNYVGYKLGLLLQ